MTSPPEPGVNDPAELKRFLDSYRPAKLPEAIWLGIAPDAVALVCKAGELTRLRVEKDIQCVGAVVAHLLERGRPIRLAEVLSDPTLRSYDLHLERQLAGERTRENKRGILRRLQAVHGGLPWRQPRRADGERVQLLVQSTGSELDRLIEVAGTHPDHEAASLLAAIAAARTARAGTEIAEEDFDWPAARRFAERHGMRLTKPILRALVTHEVLLRDEPIAVLIARFGLTRRDLDLALTQSADPAVPSRADAALLRGTR